MVDNRKVGENMTDIEIAELIVQNIAGFGGEVYFVGGFVRDRILQRENKDIDIEVHGVAPAQLEQILDSVGECIKIGKSFGIYGLKGYSIDIALPRTERLIGTGHKDFEVTADPFMGTYKAARRRDFTINALMQNVLTNEIIDHFGGLTDLQKGILRHIDDTTFSEDPLRVLRAAQFAARFDFTIADKTIALCRNIDLSVLSGERIMLEMEKVLLKSDKPSVFFEQMKRMNQLDFWFPELKALIGLPQNQEHHREGDTWTHTMMVLDEAAKKRGIVRYPLGFMMSALCHDFGKAVCTAKINGAIHSYRHETEGLPLVQQFLARITTETKLVKYVLNMTELHMTPNIMAGSRSKLKSTNKLFDSAVEPFDLIQLSICDSLGKIPQRNDSEEFLMQRYRKFQEIMAKPYVMGRDLIEAGLKPCEQFSEILEYAHKLRLAGIDKENTLRQSLVYAKKSLKESTDFT